LIFVYFPVPSEGNYGGIAYGPNFFMFGENSGILT